MKIVLVYITAGSEEEAKKIARSLVISKLAACVNIISGMNSIYFWKGELQDDRELVLIAKTTEDRLVELTKHVKAIHSYDCPCIVGIPIQGGSEDFLNWIKDQVK